MNPIHKLPPNGSGTLWNLGRLLCIAMTHVALGQASPRPNPEAGGLWIGDVTLDHVGALSETNSAPTPTPRPIQFRILLHADREGRVQLLKDVVVARRNTSVPDPILISNPALLPTLNLARDAEGAIAGRRYSTIGYDFNGTEAACTGGLGTNHVLGGRIQVSTNAPTNPFRHAFHPDHENHGPRSYAIERQFTMRFAASPNITPAAAADSLQGDYTEKLTLQGTSPRTVQVEGSITLQRISRTTLLNQ